MAQIFAFGEQMEGYPVRVLNERTARAGAGILFVFAMVAFMHAWLLGDFALIRVFVLAFLVDFTLRVFVNPKWAPSLIVGQWMVRKQEPEWTGAPQKRFAWGIGFVLAAVMSWLLVVEQMVGPINLIICAICLTLMFFETAFGICLGCKIYQWVARKKPELCPGGVCSMGPDPRIQPSAAQGLVVVVFLALVFGKAQWLNQDADPTAQPVAVQPANS